MAGRAAVEDDFEEIVAAELEQDEQIVVGDNSVVVVVVAMVGQIVLDLEANLDDDNWRIAVVVE